MISKSILKNRVINLLESSGFLLIACSFIFLLSIWIRSTMDIGADTGIYLDLGKKLYEGKRYYYDFFESNLPLSFYYYALQYKISLITKINPIILSEIFINILALLSIFWSAKILKKTTIADSKILNNLIIISYFLGFFLRPPALQIAEFGTKTSLLLIALYPYISLSFLQKNPLSKRDLIYRGLLMGIIPCIKPHYLILIIAIEGFYFLENKNIKFFFRIDRLIMALCGSLYLLLLVKLTPEFIEFITWMWPKVYPSYSSKKIFFDRTLTHFGARISIFMFVFLILSKIKLDFNDKILTVLFFAASLLMIAENAGTLDQVVIFFAIITICFVKFLYRLIAENKLQFFNHKFIILTLVFLPMFDMDNVLPSLFGLGGFISIWWPMAIIYPFYLSKKNAQKILSLKNILLSLAYIILLLISVLVLKFMDGFAYIFFSLTLLFISLFIIESKNKHKELTSLSIAIIMASASYLFYSYLNASIHPHNADTFSPSKLTDGIAYYNKKYAPKNDESFITFSDLNAYRFPILNYLDKENYSNFYIVMNLSGNSPAGSSALFKAKDNDTMFTLSYLLLDLKKQLAEQKTKLIFVNNSRKFLNQKYKCSSGTLEYYFLDPKFKKLFLKNFHFAGRITTTKPTGIKGKTSFYEDKKFAKFNSLKYSEDVILHDFEVYARN
jgi:hypothetical protein